MSTVNYEDLYEEFLLLTSSSSSSSPSVGDQSSPPHNQPQLPERSIEQMPESADFVEQQSEPEGQGPQRMSVISTAGFPIATNTPREESESGMMNPQGGEVQEVQMETHCMGMQKEQPNADELRKLLCAPTTVPNLRNHQYRPPPFPHQFPQQHFLAQCSPMSPTPTANIAWGGHTHTHSHSAPMAQSQSPPQNSYFNQQQFITSQHEHQQYSHSHQQTIMHHQTHSNTSQQICQQYQQQQQQMMNAINMRSNHWENQPFPGGLNELWRNLPVECQKYLSPQDIPESARFRGYFTVSELLVLKRNLQGRYNGSSEQHNDDEVDKGVSGTMVQNTCNKSNSKKRKRVQERPEDEQPVEESELQASCEVTVTVGVAVKEALDALDEEQQQQSQQGSSNSGNINAPIQGQNIPSTQTVTQIISSQTPSATQSQGLGSTLVQKVSMGPPPPYRTAQLVFKLLQIGNYQLRSFADLTPNKFKVLYNTQRIIYECQLPIVLPQRDDMQVLRKILTIDIGFDQISFVRFGSDKMFLRVDGAPLLTVTYNAITDDETSSPVSYPEQQLLDQIDRGQLKLSPCHQVFFINERLVHMLESQFRDHPRLKHLLFPNPTNCIDMQQVNHTAVNNNSWNNGASTSKG